MRVTLTPLSRPDDAIVLGDATHRNTRRRIRGEILALAPMPDGIEGWDSPAPPRDVEVPNLPRRDGTFWPEALYAGQRAVTVRGWHHADSSVGAANLRSRLASISGEAVSLRVEDEAGDMSVNGYVPAAPVITRVRLDLTDFSVIVACPDPLKYGDPYSVQAESGEITLHNDGTGRVPFVVSTTDRITSLDVSVGSDRVQWRGDSDGLVLDLADGVPRDVFGAEVGTLLDADEVRLSPGQNAVSVAADTPVTLTVRPGWK